LAQSAEKILIDVNTNAGLPDPLFALLKPERADEFFSIYRESYNFLKHADRDSDGYLEVHEIVGSNDLSLFMSAFRYGALFGKYTAHMFCMMMFAAVQYPGVINWEAIPDLKGKVAALRSSKLLRRAVSASRRRTSPTAADLVYICGKSLPGGIGSPVGTSVPGPGIGSLYGCGSLTSGSFRSGGFGSLGSFGMQLKRTEQHPVPRFALKVKDRRVR
jgi:hypothetical protein